MSLLLSLICILPWDDSMVLFTCICHDSSSAVVLAICICHEPSSAECHAFHLQKHPGVGILCCIYENNELYRMPMSPKYTICLKGQ